MTSPSHSGPSKRLGFLAFLATLSLGAFNDNVSKLLIMAFGTSALASDSSRASAFLSLGGMVFILPYLLFSSLAGVLADRYSKKRLMVWMKIWEIVAMVLGFFVAYLHNAYLMLVVLFCMGAQSAFFSPAKYGFLPEANTQEELPRANGATQMWTFLAIIFGGWAGGAISHLTGAGNLPAAMLFCVGIAVLGTLTSFGITRTPEGHRNGPLRVPDPVTPHVRTLLQCRRNPVLLAALLGNSVFWGVGAMAQLVLVLLAKNTLKANDQVMGLLQAALGVGIGAGCFLAGLLGSRRHPFLLVPVGGILMAAALLALGFLGDRTPWAFTMVTVAGFFSGFYMLPLTTAIQRLSPPEERGRYLGASSAMDCVGMILGSLALGALGALQLSPMGIFRVMALLALLPLPFLCRIFFRKPSASGQVPETR